MSAEQNRQSFRILAPNLSGHLQAVQHYQQIVHDLTFILFAAAHFNLLVGRIFFFGFSPQPAAAI